MFNPLECVSFKNLVNEIRDSYLPYAEYSDDHIVWLAVAYFHLYVMRNYKHEK